MNKKPPPPPKVEEPPPQPKEGAKEEAKDKTNKVLEDVPMNGNEIDEQMVE